jgi:hypothetical protein
VLTRTEGSNDICNRLVFQHKRFSVEVASLAVTGQQALGDLI